MTIPAYLNTGDTIAIVCPAGYMPFEKAEVCITTLQEWGFNVVVGKTLGHQYHYFSGTDKERIDDLQQMLDDKNVKAILCGRGGYGISRIIEELDFTVFKQSPKWVIGFSDITLLHTHLNNAVGVASLHAPMAAAFNCVTENAAFIASLYKALTGEKTEYSCSPHELNRAGRATGELFGGNLALLAHAIGSPSDMTDTRGKILFIEDIGEYIYNIDRMMIQLQRSGKLDNLAGLVVGAFSDMKDTTVPFGQTVYEVIQDKVARYNYPVCFGFSVGHEHENYALKTGVPYHLEVDLELAQLREV